MTAFVGRCGGGSGNRLQATIQKPLDSVARLRTGSTFTMETDAFLQSCLPCRHQVKSDQAAFRIGRDFSYGGGEYLGQVLRAVISHFTRPGS